MDPVYPFLEVTASALFLVAAGAAFLRGRFALLTLISAAAFGILLEEGDQLIFETYHYSENWLLNIDRAPVVIGLTWALIITGAMRITDALGVRRRYAPFVDSLLALTLDLGFDAIAIRLGLWTWRGVGPEDGWFGVPAGNFYSWLFVTLAFTFLTRWLAERARTRRSLEWLQLAVPLPAFGILLAGIVPFALLQERFDPSPGGGMIFFLVTLAAFVAITWIGVRDPEPRGEGRSDADDPNGVEAFDLRLAFFARFSIHGFFLLALFALGIATRYPMLLVVAVLMLALEVPLAWLIARRGRGTDADAEPMRPAAQESRGLADPS